MKKDLKKLISICLCIGSFACINNVKAETLSTNGGAGYSNWQDSCPTPGSCKEKTFYKYREGVYGKKTLWQVYYHWEEVYTDYEYRDKQSKHHSFYGVENGCTGWDLHDQCYSRGWGKFVNFEKNDGGRTRCDCHETNNSCEWYEPVTKYATKYGITDWQESSTDVPKGHWDKAVAQEFDDTSVINWGNWSGWQEYNPGSNTLRQVDSKKFYSYPLVLNITDQTRESVYSASGSSIKIDAPTNGSGSYTYSLVNAVTGFSVTSDGKIVHNADALGGKYTLRIKVVDNNTHAEKTVNYTVKIKPVLDIDSYPMSVGDKNVEIFMSGLKSGATVSSSQASEMKINKNLFSFKTTLTNAFSQSSNFSYKVTIDGITWDYTVRLGKSPKFLSVNSVYVIYNNADQTPKFYSDVAGYEGQRNYFDWSICDINGNNCSGTSRKNAGDYKVKLNVKSQYACTNMETECTQTKPIAFYDPSTGSATTSATINFIIDKFELKPMGQEGGNTTVSAAKEYTYDGSIFAPDVNVVVNINGNNITLKQGTDYDVSTVQDLTGAGEYDLTISGKGNYKGTIKNAGKIKVNKQTIPSSVTEKDNGNYFLSADNLWKVYYSKTHYYTGSPITPSIVIEYKHNATVEKDGKTETITNFFALKEGVDYTVSYENNTNVGTGKIIVTGMGNYEGVMALPFNIIANQFSVSQYDGYAIYTGQATTGGAKVEVNNCKDAKIEYQHPDGSWKTVVPSFTEANEYSFKYKVSKVGWTPVEGTLKTVIVKEKGNIELDKTSIELVMPNSDEINFSNATGNLTFTIKDNIVSVKQENGKIVFTPLKEGNTVVTVNVAGSKNFESTSANIYVTVRLGTLTPTNIGSSEVAYDGKPHKAYDLTITPTPDKITYTWEQNGEFKSNSSIPSFTDAGSYLVSYSASKVNYTSIYGTGKLTIKSKPISSDMISLNKTEFVFNEGKAITPEVTVTDKELGKLTNDKDYILTYSNNTYPGTATVTVTGIGNYSGKGSKNFLIKTATIQVKETDGNIEYTGFDTNGKVAKDCFYYPDGVGEGKRKEPCTQASVVVTAPSSSYTIGYTTKENAQDKDYGPIMPKFKDVTTKDKPHIIYYKVTAKGYETVTGHINVNIYRKYLKTPVAFGAPYIYTGLSQSPSWLNYNSNFMDISGTTEATLPAETDYKTTFTIKKPDNVSWDDGTTAPKTISWNIEKVCVKDHELVVENEIAYNETKQLYVSDGKVKFDRTGYNQVAWVENCSDSETQVGGLFDRNCDYSKYSFVKDTDITNYELKTNKEREEACKKIDNAVWNTNTNICHKEKLNYYDVGSAFSGTYVANQLGYDTEKSYDLYAVWSKVMYRIEYDLCDGNGCGVDADIPNPTIASYDSSFTVRNPKRVGYLFMGWEITGMDNTPHIIGPTSVSDTTFSVPEEWVGLSEDEKLNGQITMKNLTSIEDATVKLKAVWRPIEYTVKFDLNKDTYKDDNNQITRADTSGYTASMKVQYDADDVSLTKNGFKMNGYKFVGWATTKTGKNKDGSACTTYSEDIKKTSFLQTTTGTTTQPERETCLKFTDSQKFKNLTTKNNDEITLYAQWERVDVQFKATFWKENINVDERVLNSTNYTKVGTEVYTGQADSFITLDPYKYEGQNQSSACTGNGIECQIMRGQKITVGNGKPEFSLTQNSNYKSTWDKMANKYIFNTSYNNNNTTQMKITPAHGFVSRDDKAFKANDDMFRGFTLQGRHTDYYCENENFGNNYGHKYIVSPNGITNINVYYTRNTYTIIYEMNDVHDQQNTSNSPNREYQVTVTFNNPYAGDSMSTGTLKNGRNDAGSTDNTGQANFAGWFADKNVSIQVYGINGEATTNSTLFAKWLQYRYTGKNGTNNWMSWGKINE